MKTEGQIKHKLAQVRFRHLQREIRTGLSQRPENCHHNGSLTGLPGKVRLCLLASDRGDHIVCDESYGGLERAQRCPFYECRHSKESIRDSFNVFVQTADRAQVAERYPDMAALLWSLDMDRVGEFVPEVASPSAPQDPEAAPVRIPSALPIILSGGSFIPSQSWTWRTHIQVPVWFTVSDQTPTSGVL